jgi:hypothetical protein
METVTDTGEDAQRSNKELELDSEDEGGGELGTVASAEVVEPPEDIVSCLQVWKLWGPQRSFLAGSTLPSHLVPPIV